LPNSAWSQERANFRSRITLSGETGRTSGRLVACGHAELNLYNEAYWLFRYSADGTFKSIAKAPNKVELSSDRRTFTASGTITDYDATGNEISVGCVTHAALRRSTLDE
jgi:hypothetical protein